MNEWLDYAIVGAVVAVAVAYLVRKFMAARSRKGGCGCGECGCGKGPGQGPGQGLG